MILDESMGENILFHIDQISILSYNTVAEIVSKIKSFLIQIPSENNKEIMKYLDYAYYFKYSEKDLGNFLILMGSSVDGDK